MADYSFMIMFYTGMIFKYEICNYVVSCGHSWESFLCVFFQNSLLVTNPRMSWHPQLWRLWSVREMQVWMWYHDTCMFVVWINVFIRTQLWAIKYKIEPIAVTNDMSKKKKSLHLDHRRLEKFFLLYLKSKVLRWGGGGQYNYNNQNQSVAFYSFSIPW